MSATSGVVFKNLAGASFVLDSSMSIYAVSWVVPTGGTLTIASTDTYIDFTSGNITASDTASLAAGNTGVISSRNQAAPLGGLTFTASGATIVLMLYK